MVQLNKSQSSCQQAFGSHEKEKQLCSLYIYNLLGTHELHHRDIYIYILLKGKGPKNPSQVPSWIAFKSFGFQKTTSSIP